MLHVHLKPAGVALKQIELGSPGPWRDSDLHATNDAALRALVIAVAPDLKTLKAQRC
jgi:hypothetical protein